MMMIDGDHGDDNGGNDDNGGDDDDDDDEIMVIMIDRKRIDKSIKRKKNIEMHQI